MKYLNSIIDDLPTNCLFDKGRVGAGGTTLAITSSKPYVICVPYLSLAENKSVQHDNIFWFKSSTKDEELKDYLRVTILPKIICVYDAIDKLTDLIDPSKFSILIDELHILIKDYSFRRDAIKRVLNNYKLYKDFTFMTATPVEKEFLLDELVDLPLKTIEWEDVKEVNVNSIRCLRSVSETTAELINSFLNGINKGNAYIFVNSVDFIKEMIKVCKLNKDNTRIIYSKNNVKGLSIANGSTLDPVKKINLLTSTVFEGCDIYDEEGRIIIVSDNRKAHTLLDIGTSIQQIAGRIRNTKYWNEITHIYTTSRYIDVTYNEFKDSSLKQIEDAKFSAEEFNTLSERSRSKIETLVDANYVAKENNIFFFDANMVKIDMMNFKITNSIYKCRVNISEEYKKHGFLVANYDHMPDLIIDRADLDKVNFFEILDEIEKEASTPFSFMPITNKAFTKYPWLSEAITILGYDEIRKINNVTRIKEALIIKNGFINNDYKIIKLLQKKLKSGDFISSVNAKELFSNIYKDLNICKTPKGTDLSLYFEIRESMKRINDKSVKGFVIIRSKIL